MNKEQLIAAGVDYNAGVVHYGSNASMYEKFLHNFFEGGLIFKLESQLFGDDLSGAADTARDLKDAASNLSMTRLYEEMCTLLDILVYSDSTELMEAVRIFNIAKKRYRAVEHATKN